MSHIIQSIFICIDDYTTCGDAYAQTLKPLWEAAVRSSTFTVSLSACVTNLGPLVSGMMDILYDIANDERGSNTSSDLESEEECGEECEYGAVLKYSELKTIKVLGNDAGTHQH